jgi:drug/metabolite transporter (DMT)-like permease
MCTCAHTVKHLHVRTLQRPTQRQKAADIAVLAAALAVLAAGAVTASRLTSAFIVQLIFTSSPLITAVIGSLTTHEPWPPKLWETLGLTLLGSGTLTAMGAYWPAASLLGPDACALTVAVELSCAAMVVTGSLHSSKHALSWQDPIGIVVRAC